MSTYSLLQFSLEDTIDRTSLEDASDSIRTISRADCAKMQRELFGIVVSGLERAEAVTFQEELKRRDFPTELVKDDELPVLHQPFAVQEFTRRHDTLTFTDLMGTHHQRALGELVFVAGGWMNAVELRMVEVPRMDVPNFRGGSPGIRMKLETHREEVLEFTIDFFFTTSPNRLRMTVSGDQSIYHKGRALRPRDEEFLNEIMLDLRELLPPSRINSGLKRISGRASRYPSAACYEEEIRWHFHQLGAGR